MKLNIGGYLACELGNSYILDNEGVRAGFDNLRERAGSFSKLMIENESVESYISPDATLMQGSHDIRQLG